MEKRITIKQVRSEIGRTAEVRRALRALGLGRIGKQRSINASPEVMSSLKRLNYLVEIVS